MYSLKPRHEQMRDAQIRYDNMEPPEPTKKQMRDYFDDEIRSAILELIALGKEYENEYGDSEGIDKAIEVLEDVRWKLEN